MTGFHVGRLVVAAATAAATAACAATSPGTHPATSPAASSASLLNSPASPTPSASTDGTWIAAATAESIGLYRIPADTHHAVLVHQLQAPAANAAALSVTLSAGSAPNACAVWQVGSAHHLVCYASDGTQFGEGSADATSPLLVALSTDGTQLAWTTGTGSDVYSQADPDVYVATYQSGHLGTARRLAAVAGQPEPGSSAPGGYVDALGWTRDDGLVISIANQSDDHSHPVAVSIRTAMSQGWLDRGQGRGGQPLTPDSRDTASHYYAFDNIVSSSATTRVLAVERGFGMQPPTRAVTLDAATGKVVSMVAAPASGRFLVSVSGGVDGILYRTVGADHQSDPRTYWKAPNDSVGVALTGLPATGIAVVLAQP